MFRNGGPEVTGDANWKAIRDYERKKAAAAAEKAARKLKRTQNRVKKRQCSMLQVTSMTVQEVLSAQTPPLEFRDESGAVVLRKFKPAAHDCKKFMEVCLRYSLNIPVYIHLPFTIDINIYIHLI